MGLIYFQTFSEDYHLFWTHRKCEFKQSILSRPLDSPRICNGVSKMRAISQSVFYILWISFSYFQAKQGPLFIFVSVLTQSKLTELFHTQENKWYCNWGKLVPIVQLRTRACLDRCPYGMLNNGKSNSVVYKSRLVIFNKVFTFIWQIVLFLFRLTNWNRFV